MTLKTHYYPTTETFEELARKLKAMTREVKFGPLNIMKRNFDRFPKPWVGEIDKRGEYFKLFRTKGQENTSDLSVHGKYVVRSGQPHIEVKHKLHYTSLTGFAGLGVFVFCVFFLMSKKGIVVHPALQVLTCLIVLAVYGYTFYRDLKADEKLIKVLINARWEEKEEVEEDNEDDGEEYESL